MKQTENENMAVKLEDVSFQYQSTNEPNISNINLSIREGEFVVLTGGSGCGKTTITRIINGLAEKFYEGKLKGKVTVLGKSISEYPLYEIGKCVGSIFQDPKSQFFASVTEDEIAFGCENYGIDYEEMELRVSEAIKQINGNALRGKEIYPMSSGEKQKIAVASVHAVNPKIYVFDEPSANLDMYSVEALKDLMKRLKTEGHTIIVAEHRLYYLTELADRFYYMKKGHIETAWTSKELLALTDGDRKKYGLRAVDIKMIQPGSFEMAGKKELITVQNLSFAYKKDVIFNNISFKAFAGDLIAVVGHNGVGKTTLSHILCGIRKENGGKISFEEKETAARKRKKSAYFVMQNTDCQIFGDSVLEELKLSGKNVTDEQLEKLLKLYGLYELKEQHPATLSGGQKQRLTLAVSDRIDTPILILDEPTSGLDYHSMERISVHLKELAGKGKTIFVITHDYEFAAMTCNSVLFFENKNKVSAFPVKGNLGKLYDCFMQH